MQKTILDQRQLILWAGIIAPLLFTTIFMLEGWLRPGYEPAGYSAFSEQKFLRICAKHNK